MVTGLAGTARRLHRGHRLLNHDARSSATAGENSINTNVGAMVALQNLNLTNAELAKVQDRVTTGLKVICAKDNASSFAIAQGIRGDLKGIAAVQQGLANGRGVVAVRIGAVTMVSNMLIDIKAKVIEGLNPGNISEQQAILNSDYTELVSQVLNFLQNAEYNGRNILQSGSTNVNVISDTSGGSITVRAQNLEATAYSQLKVQSLTNVSSSSAALTQVNWVINTVNTTLGQLGSDARKLEFQDEFLSIVSDAVEEGLGTIVDADLAKESAKLQALQVKQQLAVQTLSIANSSPQILLGLFQG
ncbi:MAG: flagellin [Alphaproteobacteria bacterium]